MKTVYEGALTSLEVVRTYAGTKALSGEALPDRYYDRLAKRNVKIRALFPETSEAREFSGQGKDENGKAYDFSPDISVYENKITFVSPEEKFALIIESQELADAFKKAFDLSWKETQQTSKKPLYKTGLTPA